MKKGRGRERRGEERKEKGKEKLGVKKKDMTLFQTTILQVPFHLPGTLSWLGKVFLCKTAVSGEQNSVHPRAHTPCCAGHSISLVL